MDYRELLLGFKESQKSGRSAIVTKYLGPIIYRHRATGIDVIYSSELNEVIENLSPLLVKILKDYINEQAIPVIDSSLTAEEEIKFLQEYVRKKEEKAKQVALKAEKKNKKAKLKEIRKQLSNRNEKEINIKSKDIIEYLNSYDKKNIVNKAIALDEGWFIEKMNIDSDKLRVMVVLDLLINDKADFIRHINNKVINSKILGLPIKDIASYYKDDIIYPVKDVELSDTKLAIIKTIEKIVKSASVVTEEETNEFVKNEVQRVMLQKVLNMYDNNLI